MSTFAARTMHTMAFPHALGTGLLVQSPLDPDDPFPDAAVTRDAGARGTGGASEGSPDATPAPRESSAALDTYHAIDRFIDGYERALSRFRDDSTVSAMRGATHGGSFDFPDWAGPLFDLYDALVDATDGAIDPCVGEDLIRLGYDARYSFHLSPDALIPTDAYDPAMTGWNLGAIHGRATWRDDVERRGPGGTTLVVRRPIALDFGACGKGYLVDLLAQRFLTSATTVYVIDAGGDLLIQSPGKPLTIAMEDPRNTDNAVGTAKVGAGAFCASAPSRRHWEAAGHRLHHLLNAVDGLPANDVAATWVHVPAGATRPTALADGLATALFTTSATQLHDRLGPRAPFQCAILNSDRTAAQTPAFPGGFFVA